MLISEIVSEISIILREMTAGDGASGEREEEAGRLDSKVQTDLFKKSLFLALHCPIREN